MYQNENLSIKFNDLYSPSEMSSGYIELNTSRPTKYYMQTIARPADGAMVIFQWIEWRGWTGRMCEFGFLHLYTSFDSHERFPTFVKFAAFCGKYSASHHYLLLTKSHYLHGGKIIVYSSQPYFNIALGYYVYADSNTSLTLPLFTPVPPINTNLRIGILEINNNDDSDFDYEIMWRQGTPFQLIFLPVCIPTMKGDVTKVAIRNAHLSQLIHEINRDVGSSIQKYDQSTSVLIQKKSDTWICTIQSVSCWQEPILILTVNMLDEVTLTSSASIFPLGLKMIHCKPVGDLLLLFKDLPISGYLHLQFAFNSSECVWIKSGPRCLAYFVPNHADVSEWKSIRLYTFVMISTARTLIFSVNVSFAMKVYLSLAPFWRNVLPIRVDHSQNLRLADLLDGHYYFANIEFCVLFWCYKTMNILR